MKLLSSYYVAPGMWELKYEGDEEYIYLPPVDSVYIPTNILCDFKAFPAYGYIIPDEFLEEDLRLRTLLLEHGKEIRISFTRGPESTSWIRLNRGATLGFIHPTAYF